jgi:chorismate mutase
MTWRSAVARALRVPSTRAIRGAISVACDTPLEIEVAVTHLVNELTTANQLASAELISAIFTVTPDLVSAFPAEAARRAGWEGVPLLCTTEIAVPGGLPRCVRVLVHVERYWNGTPPRHVYLREAAGLRPDLVDG